MLRALQPRAGSSPQHYVPPLQSKQRAEGPTNTPKAPTEIYTTAGTTALPAFVTHMLVEPFMLLLSVRSHFPPRRKEQRGSVISAALVQGAALKQCLILEEEQHHTKNPEMHTDKLQHKHRLLHPALSLHSIRGVSMDVRMEMCGMSEISLVPGQK